MKKNIFCILTFVFTCFSVNEAQAAQPYDASPYNMAGNYVLHQTVYGELTRGSGQYEIRLIGEQPAGANFNRKLFFEIIPPKGKGDTYMIPLQDDIDGYDPRMELRNFVTREKNEIFLTVSGADNSFKNKFYVLELDEYENRFIYDSSALKLPVIKGNFRAGYQIRTLVIDTGQEKFIDLSPRKAQYNGRIYNAKNGALLRQVTAWGGEFISLQPVDRDKDGIYELRGLMVLYGTGPGDPIAQVHSVLKYSHGGWGVVSSNTAPVSGLKFVTKAAPTKTPAKKRIVRVRRATPAVQKPADSTINTTPSSTQ